ncbi:Hypothetical_protein [Hexamita inflata]|uniref:Hypothetical_protein n=1 Tax=Hexamita inflata TaxID=28002 RepID=A0AA86NLM9_9EUKA|nr:Hypothetical protein HINF_LOCUS9011 [Hexamita inflata]
MIFVVSLFDTISENKSGLPQHENRYLSYFCALIYFSPNIERLKQYKSSMLDNLNITCINILIKCLQMQRESRQGQNQVEKMECKGNLKMKLFYFNISKGMQCIIFINFTPKFQKKFRNITVQSKYIFFFKKIKTQNYNSWMSHRCAQISRLVSEFVEGIEQFALVVVEFVVVSIEVVIHLTLFDVDVRILIGCSSLFGGAVVILLSSE